MWMCRPAVWASPAPQTRPCVCGSRPLERFGGELSGHLGEVYTCRFFPSGVVILSGGADMQLKIWSAETGQCAATLRGHTGAVLATAIVDRGRNIISAGRDGHCKLWDVGEQRCLADLCEIDSVINCVLLTDLPDGLDPGSRDEPPNEREVGTEGRLVAVGSEDGCVRLVAAHSRRQLTSWQLPAAVTALSCPTPGRLAAGCRDGSVCWLEVRSGRQLGAGRRSCSPVLALRPVSGRLLVARADGTVHTEEPPDGDRADPPHTVVLCGPDCEPVYGLSDNGRQLFTAGRDCCVRRYKLPL
ncbi:proteasomal ATPase-associated factor 1-like [Amphibalanus amphitrite]|uniref:proteasomal ATPase-associated factor 1-like n=1 Tax=Amphibalanus amphitrite TaxID=1232801 RepID=UPI001C926EE0|nr:proteasomal ATPase-associated factor 1-like [Amphibalanus amphitrite]XP_043205976.1 proteasomal ATPase-associated factor 1-like [Amphibalanus amphitrite]XP_043205978.1 proteasomal ATPase-associated factor 1-like [Amphibalanus amphitrite]